VLFSGKVERGGMYATEYMSDGMYRQLSGSGHVSAARTQLDVVDIRLHRAIFNSILKGG
jgi:hypothetical protein